MKQKKITMRMCVGCKELKPKKELLRVVALPTGIIELDREEIRPRRLCLRQHRMFRKGI